MPSPQQLSAQYADIKALLDQCLASGGGSYLAPSAGAAVHFRQRAYTFRKQYREAISPAASPYDRLTLRKVPKGARKVDIEVIKLDGTFTPADGEPVTLAPQIEDDDPLLREALALRERLDL